MHMNMYFFSKFEYFMYFLVTSFLILVFFRFFWSTDLVLVSRLIYKIKHVADESVKRDLWIEDSPSKREKTIDDCSVM
jgi:hypothetical protein